MPWKDMHKISLSLWLSDWQCSRDSGERLLVKKQRIKINQPDSRMRYLWSSSPAPPFYCLDLWGLLQNARPVRHKSLFWSDGFMQEHVHYKKKQSHKTRKTPYCAYIMDLTYGKENLSVKSLMIRAGTILGRVQWRTIDTLSKSRSTGLHQWFFP